MATTNGNGKTVNTEKTKDLVTKGGETELKPGMTLKALLATNTVKSRFEEVLGKKAPGFISSIITATQINPALSACDPRTVLSAAAIAASLDLPINSSLGFAHIVPYSGKAQFQLGWRGFVQLAQRTGLYKTLNVTEVYEGELKANNRFTGLMEFDPDGKKSNVVVGYVAYMKLLNGFEKWLFISRTDAEAHGKKFSKTYDNPNGQWRKDFDAMARKTVIKALLSKWGPLSTDIQMQKAIDADQAVIDEDGKTLYVDNTDVETFVGTDVPASTTVAADRLTITVERVAKTDLNGKTVFVVTSKADKAKFYTEAEDIYALATDAKDTGDDIIFSPVVSDGVTWITGAARVKTEVAA